MNMIVAVDQNWGIGLSNHQLVTIPADMRFFRDTTLGKVVVMGRRTYEALPTGTPLHNRTNIILSKDLKYKAKDALVIHSMEELQEEIKKYPSENIYVIGGQSIYEQMLPFCDVAHVTKIDFTYTADRRCPNLDEMPDWKMVDESDEQTYYDLEYTFVKYQRISKEA